MTGRLIVVSNRLPLDGPPSGGLVVALHECLEQEGGIWVGAADDTTETPAETLTERENGNYDKMTFDLTRADYDEYYLGYANAVLWPVCHRRGDLLEFEPPFRDGYHRVNQRVARMLAEVIRPDDRVWIHDYHFFPLARYLRELGIKSRIGFFLHIPFPARVDLDALPDREFFLDWISGYDLVGVQTRHDVSACLDVFRTSDEADIGDAGVVGYRSRTFRIRNFPIGIDAVSFRAASTDADGRKLLNLSSKERLVLGVDRLDYSKGLANRLLAFGQYLDTRPVDAPRPTFLQIAPPTREGVAAYDDIRNEMERIAGAQNGKHSELDWTPIRYIHRMVPREKLAPIYRAADVALVTPVADGMNLVAKEFVAAQDPEDPGVLVLSRFAGAAEQLDAALIVNPFDISEMADAIGAALTMPLVERVERHESMAKSVFEEDIAKWTRDFLAALDPAGG